ncbi:MAG TPA: hypothetical protein VEU97_14700, partial [Ktedonobacteraceae bacterium]|nr:hypothetical protein [Ktedonobacteraceae bacterium]
HTSNRGSVYGGASSNERSSTSLMRKLFVPWAACELLQVVIPNPVISVLLCDSELASLLVKCTIIIKI